MENYPWRFPVLHGDSTDAWVADLCLFLSDVAVHLQLSSRGGTGGRSKAQAMDGPGVSHRGGI